MAVRIQTEQVRFTQGEIDPHSLMRGDLDNYYGTARRIHNFIGLRQGGLRSRPGLRYIAEILDVDDDTTFNFFSFTASDNTHYLLLFTASAGVNGLRVIYGLDIVATVELDLTPLQVTNLKASQKYDTMIICHPTMRPLRLFRNNHADWTISEIEFTQIPGYRFGGATVFPDGTLTPDKREGLVTLTSSVDIFNSESLGQYVNGNGGRVVITQVTGARTAIGKSVVAFYSTDAISASVWDYETGWDDAWSDERGWPGTAAFYEGRFILAGSLQLPSTIWFSRINDFYNFDIGRQLADEAMDHTLDASENPGRIINILAGRTLQIYTTTGEFIAVQGLEEPITPDNINIRPQSSIGSSPQLPVFEIEGAGIFCNSQSLHEFVYSQDVNAFVPTELSLFFPHMVRDPQSLAVRKAYTTTGQTIIALVNKDGALATITIMREQSVLSSSQHSTQNRNFINAGTDGYSLYFITDTKIGDVRHCYLEYFDDNSFLDCSTTITNTDEGEITVGGLERFNGKNIWAVCDDYVFYDLPVSNGTVTVPDAGVVFKNIEVGYNYESVAVDNPVQTPGQGSTANIRKRVSEISVYLFETTTCNINGREMEFKELGSEGTRFGQPGGPFTGWKKVRGFRGWDKFGSVEIRKTRPGRLEILDIVKRVTITE